MVVFRALCFLIVLFFFLCEAVIWSWWSMVSVGLFLVFGFFCWCVLSCFIRCCVVFFIFIFVGLLSLFLVGWVFGVYCCVLI